MSQSWTRTSTECGSLANVTMIRSTAAVASFQPKADGQLAATPSHQTNGRFQINSPEADRPECAHLGRSDAFIDFLKADDAYRVLVTRDCFLPELKLPVLFQPELVTAGMLQFWQFLARSLPVQPATVRFNWASPGQRCVNQCSWFRRRRGNDKCHCSTLQVGAKRLYFPRARRQSWLMYQYFKKRQCLSVRQATADDYFRLKFPGINLPYTPSLNSARVRRSRDSAP